MATNVLMPATALLEQHQSFNNLESLFQHWERLDDLMTPIFHHSNNMDPNELVPGRPFDVMCGRGKVNPNLHAMVNGHRESYRTAKTKLEKTQIASNIVYWIRACGGRFLKKDEKTGQFQEVKFIKAREKVSHLLRDGSGDGAFKSARAAKRNSGKNSRNGALRKHSVSEQEAGAQDENKLDSLLEAQSSIFENLLKEHLAREEQNDIEEV